MACGEAAAGTACSTATEASQALLGSLTQGAASPSGERSSEEAEQQQQQQQPSGASSSTGIQKLLGVDRDDLVAQEKAVLEDVVALLKEVCMAHSSKTSVPLPLLLHLPPAATAVTFLRASWGLCGCGHRDL